MLFPPHPNPLPQEFGQRFFQWLILMSEFSGERELKVCNFNVSKCILQVFGSFDVALLLPREKGTLYTVAANASRSLW